MSKEVLENVEREEQVTALLRTLKPVEAPANFEANVRSRIVDGEERSMFANPGILLGLKFALPLVVLLVFGAFLFSISNSKIDEAMVPPPADDKIKAPLLCG